MASHRPADGDPELIRRPLRDLMAGLARLPVQTSGEPDFTNADPDHLVRLAESAELAFLIVHEGLASIGVLYAHAAQLIAEGRIKAHHAAALGRLYASYLHASPTMRSTASTNSHRGSPISAAPQSEAYDRQSRRRWRHAYWNKRSVQFLSTGFLTDFTGTLQRSSLRSPYDGASFFCNFLSVSPVVTPFMTLF
jgi:hypothetical protein